MIIIKRNLNWILFWSIFTAQSSNAATYYVAQTGNNKNPGNSWETAWRTLQHASNQALPGDTIIIRKGSSPYKGMAITNSGASEAPIIFMGESKSDRPVITGGVAQKKWTKDQKSRIWTAPTSSEPTLVFEGKVVTLKASSTALTDGQWYWQKNTFYYRPSTGTPKDHHVLRSSSGGGILIKNKSWIHIKNIECYVGKGACINIQNGHHNIATNFRARWHWRGVNIDRKSSHNLISDCIVENNREGIYILGQSSHNTVTSCKALHNGNLPYFKKADRAGIAIGENGPNKYNTIQNCEIAYNGGPNSDPGLIAYRSPHSVFRNNHVHDNYGSGVFVTINSHDSQIINNLIENNGVEAVAAGYKGIVGLTVRHGSKNTMVKDNIITNNYVSSDSPWKSKDMGPKGGLDLRALPKRDDMSGIEIINNTINGTVGGPDLYIGKHPDLNKIKNIYE